MRTTIEASNWYSALNESQRAKVRAWLDKNRPPREWQGTAVDYAFTEMPFAPMKREWMVAAGAFVLSLWLACVVACLGGCSWDSSSGEDGSVAGADASTMDSGVPGVDAIGAIDATPWVQRCGVAPYECCADDAAAGRCDSPDVCGYDGYVWRCIRPPFGDPKR